MKELVYIVIALFIVLILVFTVQDGLASTSIKIKSTLCDVFDCTKETIEQLPGVYDTDIPEEILLYYELFVKENFNHKDIDFTHFSKTSGALILYPKLYKDNIYPDYKDYDRYFLEIYPVEGEGLYFVLRDTDEDQSYLFAKPSMPRYTYLKNQNLCVLPRSNNDGIYENDALTILENMGTADYKDRTLTILNRNKIKTVLQAHLTRKDPAIVYGDHSEQFVKDITVPAFMAYAYHNWTCFFPTVTKSGISFLSANDRVHLKDVENWVLKGKGFIYTELIKDIIREDLEFKKVV